MSRTKHSSKAPGYEYWSRRPFNRHGCAPSPAAKRRTHKAERMKGKQNLGALIAELDQEK